MFASRALSDHVVYFLEVEVWDGGTHDTWSATSYNTMTILHFVANKSNLPACTHVKTNTACHQVVFAILVVPVVDKSGHKYFISSCNKVDLINN